ncbi:MAG TPA: TlpA family protein disulfide reductase [Nitrospirales bacterium]|nr:TlpA family protein disulfide reductase [Nitrospirales bacterium]HIO22455.1 TlpA family protein disulfide reductase [Nitrospirales bacterium]
MLIGLLMVLLIPTMWASEIFAKQPAVLEGEMTAPSPDFEFTTLSGERVTKEALKGKPTLLMFWATWCGICRDELPRIHELDTQARSMGLQIVAVAFSDDKNAVTKYVEQHKSTFSFPTVFDAGNDVSSQFRVRATPTFFLLDGNGDILLMHIGGGILGDRDFRRLMHELLT